MKRYLERIEELTRRYYTTKSSSERALLRDAIDVYAHLLECRQAHSLPALKSGRKRCKFFDAGFDND